MLRFGSGFAVGFFLAMLLVFGAVQVHLGPCYEDLKTIRPHVLEAYNLTHSGEYAELQGFVSIMGQAGYALAALPFVGETVDAAQIPQYAAAAGGLMEGAKEISERVLPLVEFGIAIIEISIPAILASIFMIAVGAGVFASTLIGKNRPK